ncbi:hypothetical protein ACYSNO_03365 [Enterococcus sp. LJL98]
MNTFFSTNYQMNFGAFDHFHAYKIPLEGLISLFDAGGFHTSNIGQLTQQLYPTLSPNFHEEIYAVLPIQQHQYKRTVVVYRDYLMYVEMAPFPVIKRLLSTSPLLNFNAYTKTLQCLFNCNTTIIPVATDFFSLIPLGPVKSNETIWVNPGRIRELKNDKMKTLLTIDNQFPIASDRLIKGITGRMLKGFLAHGILKREVDAKPVWPSMNLLEYLELPATPAVRHVLRHFQFQHLPKLQGDFFLNYELIYHELLRQNLLDDLDIEE